MAEGMYGDPRGFGDRVIIAYDRLDGADGTLKADID